MICSMQQIRLTVSALLLFRFPLMWLSNVFIAATKSKPPIVAIMLERHQSSLQTTPGPRKREKCFERVFIFDCHKGVTFVLGTSWPPDRDVLVDCISKAFQIQKTVEKSAA